MATDGTDEVVTLAVNGENGTRSIQLPEGWIESAVVQARRIGRQVVLEPVVSDSQPRAQSGEGESAWRHVDGFRVHPSWPAGYVEWLLEAQKSGELEIGDPDDLRRSYQDPRPE